MKVYHKKRLLFMNRKKEYFLFFEDKDKKSQKRCSSDRKRARERDMTGPLSREIQINNMERLKQFFAQENNIITVYVFGSHGTEQETENSDLDLAVLFSEKPSLMPELYLAAEIEKIIKTEIDFLSLNRANVLLQHRVLKEGQKIYEKDKLKTAEFKETVLKEYFDFGMTLKKFRNDFNEGLGEEFLHLY